MNRALMAVALLVVAGAAACRPGEPGQRPGPARPGAETGALPGREPVVRIGIVIDSETAQVGARGSHSLAIAGGRTLAQGGAAETWMVRAGTAGLEASSASGQQIGPVDGIIRVRADDGVIMIGDRPYRGDVLIQARGGGRLTAINVLDLEAYLLGVVPREIGRLPARDIEAIKAQAVAARTYAVGNLGGRARLGFDFYATVQDQVYGGVLDEDTVVTRAVRETAGRILTYRGQPILAYYSSTCGGRTANIEDAWPWRSPLPYLRSVSDRIPGTEEDYCGFSNRYRWTATWTRAQLLAVLGRTLVAHKRAESPVRRIESVAIAERSRSGTVSVDVHADGQAHRLRADSLRWVLRPESADGAILNSARLHTVEATVHEGGVEGLEVHGAGWGHAVGMCQVGAIGRARAGQRYEEILQAYYTDTQITRLY
jgi:stage II sporulation protein D